MDESFAREICHAETDLTTKVQQQEWRDVIAINRDIIKSQVSCYK